MRLNHFIMLFFVVGLLGCASLGEKYSPVKSFSSSKALVYIYRVPKFAGSAGSPYVCIDGKVVGEVVDGGYFATEVDPGEHNISLKSLGSETHKFQFKVSPNKTYYLRSDFSLLKEGTGGGLVGDAIWGASSDEKKKILDNLDQSAQGVTEDASLLFVNKNLAEAEIVKNKKFKVPEYNKNHCAKSENKMKKKR